jgi:hydrogenase nickel incorporation protein HypA/HybF
MHELSIATSMVEMAGEEAARHPDTRVVALHLKLGPLSGVVKEALLFFPMKLPAVERRSRARVW